MKHDKSRSIDNEIIDIFDIYKSHHEELDDDHPRPFKLFKV